MKNSNYFIATLLTLVIWIAPVSAQYETEPNNDIDTADSLALGESIEGAATDDFSTSDFFRVWVPEHGTFVLDFDITNGQLCSVGLIYANGLSYTGGLHSGTGTFEVSNLAPGEYYIYFSTYWAGASSTYIVTYTSFTSTGVPMDAEPNNTSGEAIVLPINGEKTGHTGYYDLGVRDSEDWYAIILEEDGDITLRLTEVTSWVDVTLYDNDGVTSLINGHIESVYNDSTVVRGLAPGTYYLKIRPHYPNGYSTYKIENSFSVPMQANDPEPNNTAIMATPLTLDSTVTGHNGYYYNLARDYEDWYSIAIPQGGYLSLTLTPHAGNVMFMDLYSNDGVTLIKQTYSATTFDLKQNGLEAGNYLLRLTTSNYYPNTGYNPYTLTNTYATYTFADDDLDNNYAADAVTLIANDTTYGHVGFVGNSGTDYVDWWKINYTGDGSMHLHIYSEPSLESGYSTWFRVKIYNDTAATAIHETVYNGTADINLAYLAQGIYYVCIEPNANYPFIGYYHSYSITSTYTEINIAEADEFISVPHKGCGNNSIHIQVSGSNAPYTAQLYRFGNMYGDAITIPDTNLFVIENLQPGNYYAEIKGDGASDDAISTTATVNLVPRPKNVDIIHITADAATLDWKALPLCLDVYKIQWKQTGATEWHTDIVPVGVSEYTFDELLPNTDYQCRIWSAVFSDDLSTVAESNKVKRSFTTGAERLHAHPDQQVISAYPNPATKKIYIQTQFAPEQVMEVAVSDMTGRVIYYMAMNAEALRITGIDVTSLPSGLYMVNIFDTTQMVFNEKISVIR